MKARSRLAAVTLPVFLASAVAQAQLDDDLLAPLVKAEGQLSIKLSGGVTLAKLFVDGQEKGVLPMAPLKLATGTHKVEVKRPGFKDFSRTVNLRARKTVTLAVKLQPVAGVLSVQADVPGAEIVIDGKWAGVTPVSALLVSPGEHEVQVRRAGYEPDISRMAISAGKDYALYIQLKPTPSSPAVAQTDRPVQPTLTPSNPRPASPLQIPPPPPPGEVSSAPWYGRWYVWTGVGVVAGVAAVGTAMALSQKPRPVTPEEVCGGPCDAILNGPAAIRF